VIDLKAGKLVKTISQLKEPQGIVYVPEADRLYVANGDDGSVRIFDGSSYALLKTLDFGEDADNLRYDSGRKRVYVGYGAGALGEIDNDGRSSPTSSSTPTPKLSSLRKTVPGFT